MVELGRANGFHEAEVVGDGAEMGKQFGKGESAPPVRVETIGRSEQLGMSPEKGKTFAREERLGGGLAVVFSQDGFFIEEIELRGSAGHVEKDHPFRPRCHGVKGGGGIGETLALEERPERKRTDPDSGAGEEAAAIRFKIQVHSQTTEQLKILMSG